MKKLVDFIRINKNALFAVLIAVLFVYLLSIVTTSKITDSSLKEVYDTLERRLRDERSIIDDSIAVYDERITEQKEQIDRLEGKLRKQSLEIDKIKKDYEDRRNNINGLDVDGVISESRKQLSK